MDIKEFIKYHTPQEQDLIQFFSAFCMKNKPKEILEIGSGWGIFSGSVMRFSNAKLTTVDKRTLTQLKEWEMKTKGYEDRIIRITEDSHKYIPTLFRKKEFDIIYVDGDHTEKGAKQDLLDAWGLLKHNGLLLIDDVFHKENWQYIDEKQTELNFGVTKALWSFIQAWSHEFAEPAQIYNLVHGFVVIKKK